MEEAGSNLSLLGPWDVAGEVKEGYGSVESATWGWQH